MEWNPPMGVRVIIVRRPRELTLCEKRAIVGVTQTPGVMSSSVFFVGRSSPIKCHGGMMWSGMKTGRHTHSLSLHLPTTTNPILGDSPELPK